MTLRIHQVSASRWKQLAASRLPIDLTAEEASEAAPDKSNRLRSEYADIQAQIDAIAKPGISANR